MYNLLNHPGEFDKNKKVCYNLQPSLRKKLMSATIVKYTPPSLTVTIPEGWELAEAEPRFVKNGERFLSWDSGENKWYLCKYTKEETISTHAYNKDHPILGKKTFIVREKFNPVVHEVIEVYCDAVQKWKKRVFIKKVGNSVLTFNRVSKLEDVQENDGLATWSNFRKVK